LLTYDKASSVCAHACTLLRMKSTGPLVNWSIRLSQDEAAEWDELLYALRRESGVRTLNKTDIVRGLIDLVDDPQVRAKLLRVLKVAA
jgi:hypothetical protein